jgi:DNA-binding NtrC family response regulator
MSEEPTVLVVDDEQEECRTISDTLRRAGYHVECVADAAHAESFSDRPVHAIVSKLKLSGNGKGIKFVQNWKKQHPETPVVAIASPDGVDEAVAAMRMGVVDCLPQPIDPLRLTESLRHGLERDLDGNGKGPSSRCRVEDRRQRPEFGRMVGGCAAMQRVFEQAALVAETEATVLITGSTGTGKELMADAIHRLSTRSRGPFVAVNVAAVPNSLIESELFGHVKGAFTDAATDRVGRFEAASGGSLFIDEIGDLKLQSQAKLLRVLETHVINRVGSNQDVAVDVRVIAATSRDLSALLTRGQFREDLYYRLNVVQIRLPDLRERQEDIPLLVRHFLDDLSRRQNKSMFAVDEDLGTFLQEFEWPGNIRQLKNCLESMVVMAGNTGVLTLDDLPPTLQQPAGGERLATLPLGGYDLAELEREAICQTLDQFDGNRTRAAHSLGVSVRTLQRKLKQWKEECRVATAT